MADAAVPPAFARAMVVLAEAVGGSLSEQKIRIYWQLLGDIPIADLERAVYRCCRERDGRFQPADLQARIPPVSEIRAYAVTSVQDAAVLAWAGLQRAARTVGAYASLEVEDGPTAAALVRVFGSWPAFCETDEGPALALKRQEFLAAYRQTQMPPRARRRWRLAGICEAGGNYVAGRTVFVGLLTADGRVVEERDHPQLTGGPDGLQRPALGEAGAAAADQGAEGPARGGGREGGPGDGGGA